MEHYPDRLDGGLTVAEAVERAAAAGAGSPAERLAELGRRGAVTLEPGELGARG